MDTKKAVEYLGSEEGRKKMEEAVEKMFDKMEKKRQKAKEFALNKQEKVIKEIVKYFKSDDNDRASLYDDLWQYGEDKDFLPCTSDEFFMLFDNLMDYADSKQKTEVDRDCSFPNLEFYVQVEDSILIFYFMQGQGASQSIVLADDEEVGQILEYKKEILYSDYVKEREVE